MLVFVHVISGRTLMPTPAGEEMEQFPQSGLVPYRMSDTDGGIAACLEGVPASCVGTPPPPHFSLMSSCVSLRDAVFRLNDAIWQRQTLYLRVTAIHHKMMYPHVFHCNGGV